MEAKIKRYLYTILFTSIGYGSYMAINMLFFLEKGLDFQTISFLFILLHLFVLLCEIPTGIIADKIKPVNAVILGSIIIVLSRLLFLFDFLYIFEISMIVYGVGISFISGATNSVLVGLKSASESSERLFSLSLTYRSIGAILGGAGSYYLFAQNIHYPWLYSAWAYLMVAIILWRYRQDYQFPAVEQLHIELIAPLFKSLITKSFFWASVFYATSALAPFLLWQYLFKQFPYGVESGYIALQLGMLISSKLARLISFTENKRVGIIIFNLIIMLLMPFFSDSFSVLFILLALHVGLVGLQNIFFNANFHDNIQQSTRSTSESLMSAFDSALSMPMLFLIGYFMDQDLLLFAFAVSINSGIIALYLFMRSRKNKAIIR